MDAPQPSLLTWFWACWVLGSGGQHWRELGPNKELGRNQLQWGAGQWGVETTLHGCNPPPTALTHTYHQAHLVCTASGGQPSFKKWDLPNPGNIARAPHPLLSSHIMLRYPLTVVMARLCSTWCICRCTDTTAVPRNRGHLPFSS